MAKQYEVVAKIMSQKGTCAAGHKVGDEFAVGDCTTAGMGFLYNFPVRRGVAIRRRISLGERS